MNRIIFFIFSILIALPSCAIHQNAERTPVNHLGDTPFDMIVDKRVANRAQQTRYNPQPQNSLFLRNQAPSTIPVYEPRPKQIPPIGIVQPYQASSYTPNRTQIAPEPQYNTAPLATVKEEAIEPFERKNERKETSFQYQKPYPPAVAPNVVINNNFNSYTVKRGDTIYSISKYLGITPNELKRINNLDSNIITIGQRLVTVETNKYAKKDNNLYKLQKPEPFGRQSVAKSYEPAPQAPAYEPLTNVEKSANFISPIRKSAIINDLRFAKASEAGINIQTLSGSAVRASGDGKVIFAEHNVKNFGNMVILEHSGGYMTAYAHLDKISIQRGANIPKGSIIGSVGNTGDVSKPTLHFALRKNQKNIDPRTLITF